MVRRRSARPPTMERRPIATSADVPPIGWAPPPVASRPRPISAPCSAVYSCLHLRGCGYAQFPYEPACTVQGRWCSWLTNAPLGAVSSIPVAVTPSEPGAPCIRSSSLPRTLQRPRPTPVGLLGGHADIPSYADQCHPSLGRAATRRVCAPATAGYVLMEQSGSVRRRFGRGGPCTGCRLFVRYALLAASSMVPASGYDCYS